MPPRAVNSAVYYFGFCGTLTYQNLELERDTEKELQRCKSISALTGRTGLTQTGNHLAAMYQPCTDSHLK